MIPVHDEEATVGDVVPRAAADRARPPGRCRSSSTTAPPTARPPSARAAGATVVAQPRNLGLGAAVRRGLAEASARSARRRRLPRRRRRVLPRGPRRRSPPRSWPAPPTTSSGRASPATSAGCCRTAGSATWSSPGGCAGSTRRRDHRRPERLPGLLPAPPRPTAEIVHDYNYAQVLTLDLLGKGLRLRRGADQLRLPRAGTSFVRLGRYLRRVLPAVHRELNDPTPAQSSTTWLVEPLPRRGPRVARRTRPSARSASPRRRPSRSRGGCCRARTARAGRTSSPGGSDPAQRSSTGEVRSRSPARRPGRRDGSRLTTMAPRSYGGQFR